jgi:hypothetical protein
MVTVISVVTLICLLKPAVADAIESLYTRTF